MTNPTPTPNGTIGASQKAVVFNQEGKMLTMFRTETAPTRPNTWDLPGGDLDLGEDAIESIVREITEETGLAVTNVRPFDVESLINPEGTFWITIAYYAQASSDDVKLSYEHNDYRWVTIDEFLEINTSKRAQRFIESLLKLDAAPHMQKQ
jgi:8-oxo-dGTP diphosphatase